ncbi:MAG: ABC transporter substrate-binding protein [Anaerolineales bacterium]|nr:ABC transporter substrate-binding protein [Anaerolineales bacterium]
MKRRSVLVFTMLFITPLFSSCIQAVAPETPEEELIPLKLVSLPFLSFAPIHIALEEGYFEEQGLDVELISFERGADAFTALIGNDVDVWAGGISATLFNAIARSDIRIVASRGYFPADECGYSAHLLKKDLFEEGEVSSPEDLAGLRIVQDDEGSYRDYGLRLLLAEGNLSLEDVEILTVPDPSLIDGFLDGSIDLAAVSEPRITSILETGSAVRWITFGEIMPDFQFGFVVFSSRLIEEEPQTGEKFIAAYLEGLQQYSEGRTERNIEILTTATGLEPATLESACWPEYQTDGQINVESILTFQEWLVQEEYLESVLEPEDFMDSSFID